MSDYPKFICKPAREGDMDAEPWQGGFLIASTVGDEAEELESIEAGWFTSTKDFPASEVTEPKRGPGRPRTNPE